jgi:enoyl-CoA hydratase/carnithine racemase
MGVSQAGTHRLAIVTETTRMAMPEVHIGLFPDVGGSYFLSRLPGKIGRWLALTGETIKAADALYCGLADTYLPSGALPELLAMLRSLPVGSASDISHAVRKFAAPYARDLGPGLLAEQRDCIDRLFAGDTVSAIALALEQEAGDFAASALASLRRGSPVMLCVTLEQLRRGAAMTVADCLRMERAMVRRCFERTEVLEGIRARVIEKDNEPRWSPSTLAEVDETMVDAFFEPVWPADAHPLRQLEG